MTCLLRLLQDSGRSIRLFDNFEGFGPLYLSE